MFSVRSLRAVVAALVVLVLVGLAPQAFAGNKPRSHSGGAAAPAATHQLAGHRAKKHHKHRQHHSPHSVNSSVAAPHAQASGKIGRFLSVARAQKGDPYSYGAAGPNAFDCSGLVYYSAHKAGIGRIPRTSSGQSGFARHIGRASMHPGDLIFFTSGGSVYHVGLYAGMSHGRRLVLHSPRPGGRVSTVPLWTDSWFAGTLRGR